MRHQKADQGLTLSEIIISLGLAVVLVGLSLSAMQSSKSKVPIHGLVAALSEEFNAARQLAIASGRPVALGIPTGGGTIPAATSVYRLEGWNKPLITAVRDFRGDYPRLSFLAARWAGPTFTEGLEPSGMSKYKLFNLDHWLQNVPNDVNKDYIFCFTPDGGLVSNKQPATGGKCAIVVAQNPTIGGSPPNKRTLQGADAAVTLLVSPDGGIDHVTGIPGGTLGAPGSGGTSPARTLTSYGGGGATVKISEIRVLPNPDTALPGEGTCVPGQVVTLEVYAYDPEGRGLFSKWTQEAVSGTLPPGQFSYPYSDTNRELLGEVDKMEFVYKVPRGVVWVNGSGPPEGVGVFRARWNWTVPISSSPGDRYSVQADVRDVKGEVFIQNPPRKVFTTPPSGKLLVERLGDDGLWELVLMNPDGSGEKVLSPPGVEECMPSLDRSGTKMAFLQGQSPSRYVKVRNLHGGPEQILDGADNFTSVSISPDGAWVSYRNHREEKLYTKKLDGSGYHEDLQPFSGGGHGIKKSRTGWSQDSRYMLYEKDHLIYSRRLSDGHSIKLISKMFWNTIPDVYDGSETPYAPISYSVDGGGERVMLSLGSNNPVLVSFPVTPDDYEDGGINPGNLYQDYHVLPTGDKLRVGYGGNGGSGGSGTDNDYPSISSDGKFLIWTRSPQTSVDGSGAAEDVGEQKLWIVPRNGDNFIQGPGGPTIMSQENVRRAIWIPAQ